MNDTTNNTPDTDRLGVEGGRDFQETGTAADSVRSIGIARQGERLFFVVFGAVFCIVALPVLMLCLLNFPLPQQEVSVLGVSFHSLALVLFISAACLILSLLFCCRYNVYLVLAVFMVCLFCCIPFITGLKNDFTVQQTLKGIPFFTSWPFYVRPVHIFVQLVIPAGILTCIFLQLYHFFVRKSKTFVFLGAAVYLLIAAFVGFAGLLQAGQPNVISALAGEAMPGRSTADPTPNKPEGPPDLLQPRETVFRQSNNQTESPLSALVPPEDNKRIEMLEHKVGRLEETMARVLEKLTPIPASTAKDEGEPSSLPSGLVSPEKTAVNQTPKDPAFGSVIGGMAVLSQKIDQVHEKLALLGRPADADRQTRWQDDMHRRIDALAEKMDLLLKRIEKKDSLMTQAGSADEKNKDGLASPAMVNIWRPKR